jgi:hypothetical protein
MLKVGKVVLGVKEARACGRNLQVLPFTEAKCTLSQLFVSLIVLFWTFIDPLLRIRMIPEPIFSTNPILGSRPHQRPRISILEKLLLPFKLLEPDLHLTILFNELISNPSKAANPIIDSAYFFPENPRIISMVAYSI